MINKHINSIILSDNGFPFCPNAVEVELLAVEQAIPDLLQKMATILHRLEKHLEDYNIINNVRVLKGKFQRKVRDFLFRF